MFPDKALYIHQSITFVDYDFTCTVHVYNILSQQICFRSTVWQFIRVSFSNTDSSFHVFASAVGNC